MGRSLCYLALLFGSPLFAQPPIPPPAGTDFNIFIPANWNIQTLSTTGFVWSSSMGYGGSGGLVMDCGACASYQESTIWSPWLDLSNDPLIDVTFRCAIIGSNMMVPPPIFVLRDGVGGPEYIRRYGYANLIPPPDEVIASSNNPFPPLDPNNVQWVDITYPFFAGLNNDSVRIGVGSGIPLGGWSLLDDIGIGGLPTSVGATPDALPIIMRTSEAIIVQCPEVITRAEMLDPLGRIVRTWGGDGSNELTIATKEFATGIHFLRLQQKSGEVVVRVGP